MPLYDYECKKCKILFEENIKMDDRLVPTESPCPSCGAREVKQILLTMNIGDPIKLGITRPSSEFNDVLTKINERVPRGRIHEKLSQGRRKRGLDY